MKRGIAAEMLLKGQGIKLKLLISAGLLLNSAMAYSTQDVASPEEQLKYLRILLASPVLIKNIQHYANQGCEWTNESIWFGAPSVDTNGKKQHFGGISIQFENEKNEREWLSHFFLLNDSSKLIEINRNPKSLMTLICATD